MHVTVIARRMRRTSAILYHGNMGVCHSQPDFDESIPLVLTEDQFHLTHVLHTTFVKTC